MKYFYQSFIALLALTIICGIIYPLFIFIIGKTVFPFQANGSIIEHNGQPIGSTLIGQQFSGNQYFWPRPSATANYPYDALASGGSNLGPLNPALIDAVKQRALQLQQTNSPAPIPVDLVTASGSGLDPDISIAGAYYQMQRIAQARHISVSQVQEVIDRHSHYPLLGFLGTPHVNVLELNLALDSITTQEEK